MATDHNDSTRLPGPGERIRRLAENPVPTGGVPLRGLSPVEERMHDSGVPGVHRLAHGGAHGAPANAPHDAVAAHGHGGHEGDHGHHPTAKLYVMIGLLLTAITALEVSAYYIPAWEGSPIYVPSMLLLSAIKFIVVVMFYMHLKYDHKLFRALFTGPFVIAFATLFGLMFLFGKLAVRLGLLS
jgi:cytochrome c oxidase subunit 4